MEMLVDLGDVCVARATRDDVGTIERLLADDPTSPQHVATNTLISDDLLGAGHTDTDLGEVFDEIRADPNQDLLVICDEGDRVIGTLQVTFVRTMARGGGVRAVVSGARVRAGRDSLAIAKRVFAWVIEHCRARGARVLIVVTDKNRAHIHGFYTTMGFRPSHDGLTLPL
ncbi:MAG TPA: GNAT family N-acetyltransferase [Propionibacterium sp.]|nr:GNAT family N-acetyltransferase [Propionibacterium sp.]